MAADGIAREIDQAARAVYGFCCVHHIARIEPPKTRHQLERGRLLACAKATWGDRYALVIVEHGCLEHYGDAPADTMYRVIVKHRRHLFSAEPDGTGGTFASLTEALYLFARYVVRGFTPAGAA